MNVCFDSNSKQYNYPQLGLYYRDKVTQVAILKGISNLQVKFNLNAFSEITFDISSKIFDSVIGEMVVNENAYKIKKGMLIKTTNMDNILNIPTQWNENNNVIQRELLSINWWLVTNIDNTNDKSKESYTVTLTSYDCTQRERKIFISSNSTDEDKQVIKLSSSYVVLLNLPTANETYKIYLYEPSGNFTTDITDCFDFSYFTDKDKDIEISYETKMEIIELFLGKSSETILASSSPNRYKLSFAGGVFQNGSNYKLLDNHFESITTSPHYFNTNESLQSKVFDKIMYVLSNIPYWKYTNSPTHFPNYQSDGNNHYINLRVWNTFQEYLETTQSLWKVGYVSPKLKQLYRTIDNNTTDIYDWVTTIEEKFNCFAIRDCDKNTINFYTQEDLFVNNSGCYFTLDNILTTTQINTSDKELVTCCHIYSADNTDYSIGYVNPIGSNLVYNFGDYLSHMSDDLVGKLDAWNSRIKSLEPVFKRLGFLRFYYIQTINRCYSNMLNALDKFKEIADEVNTYIKSKDIKGTTQKRTNYNVGDIIPLTPSFWTSDEYATAVGFKSADEVSNLKKRGIFSDYDLYANYSDTNLCNNILMRLQPIILKYYQTRLTYINVKNRYFAVNAMTKVINSLCALDGVTLDTKINEILNLSVSHLTQSKELNTADTVDVFQKSRISTSGNPKFSDILKLMATDNYNTLFTEKFRQGTVSSDYPTGFIPTIKGSMSSIKDFSIYDNTIFNSTDISNLQYYIIEGNYTDEFTVFEDLDADESTIVNRHASIREIINNLSNLYQKAKSDMEYLSQQTYDFTLSTINMLMANFDEITNKNYNNNIYIGATINAEIKENHWEQPVILSIELNYDEPTQISFVCSNNYKQKPLEYRFEKLYNDTSRSTSLDLDYSSNWFDN